MKNYEIPIGDEYLSLFFAPIRSKKHIIKLLMNTIKYVNNSFMLRGERNGLINIIVDDMNRFIFTSADKVFSIRSPFHVRKKDDQISFYTDEIALIDSSITSRVLAAINDDRFDSPNSLDFLYLLEEVFGEGEVDTFWSLMMMLLTFEDGYLRFDHDPEHEDGRMHPLTHLDICYSTASTYKIGTYTRPCPNFLSNLLNTNTESVFIESR
ncbi:hypothetical protein ACGDLY_015965 [Vibrio campbellii]|uniref:hypothetical protein n=1 Tax=Vibrio campbellii TaxID=680 RepID=UPI000CD351B3|nr:hypothetical protein [Vibrio campbellii]AUW04923.1 hypothetical protein C1N51_15145 [Vibrio campbellii]